MFDTFTPNPIVDFSRAVQAFSLAARNFSGAADSLNSATRFQDAWDHIVREETVLHHGPAAHARQEIESDREGGEADSRNEPVRGASANEPNTRREAEDFDDEVAVILHEAAAYRARLTRPETRV